MNSLSTVHGSWGETNMVNMRGDWGSCLQSPLIWEIKPNTVENPHDYWQRGKLVGCLLSGTKELNYKKK